MDQGVLVTIEEPAAAAARAESESGRQRARDDLIPVTRSRWSLWPCASVRATGFPVATLLQLSSPACARMAARLLRARATRRSRPSRDGSEPIAVALAALKDTFAAERQRISTVLRDVAADPAFREAVLWQNRGAFTRAVDPLTATPACDGSGLTRKRELLVASYLQRYCAKNETIGFFGPVGWARCGQSPVAIAATCGPGLVATRDVHFESWCIDTIARTLDRDPDLRPWRVPHVPSFVRLEGARLMIGSRPVRDLSSDGRRLFAACDGERHAQAIARELRSAGAAFPSDDAVYDLLEEWQRAGHLAWTFEGPRELRPERTLRRRLEQIDEPALRARASAVLGEVESAREAVRHAAGNPQALDRAIESLDSSFTRLTGVAPTRRDGQTYAARTLVYTDCRRDASLDVGAEVWSRLGAPLSLLLHSVQWAVHELARRHAAEFRRTFDGLTDSRRRPVGLGVFLPGTSLYRTAPGTLSTVGAEVQAMLQQRWAGVLRPPPGARRVQYRSRDLRPAVLDAFAAPDELPSTWARAVSPDVMIDAPSIEAIRRGEYRLVLGELHLYNTLQQAVFVDHHPRPDEIMRLLELDYPAPLVMWIDPKDRTPHRGHLVPRSNDLGYTGSRDPSPLPASRTLRIADLEVADDAGALVVRTRDGRVRSPCLEFFGGLMMRRDVGLFSVLAPAPHQPRITLDDVIISRERWQVPASEIPCAACGDDVERFVMCRRWVQQLGLPQFAFMKIPNERKPTYIDFESPVYVDAFARSARNVQRRNPSGAIAITEMLPVPDGAWLPDAAGRRYTSELRIVAVHRGGRAVTDEPVPGGRHDVTAAAVKGHR